jgi:hypothetical protein
MRCIDSAIKICSRRVAPLWALCLRAWCSSWVAFWSPGCGTWMEPHPSAIPKLGDGQSSGACGQSLLARSHIILTGRPWQLISMCSMFSSELCTIDLNVTPPGSARFGTTPDPEPDRRSGSAPTPNRGPFGSGPKFRTKPQQHYLRLLLVVADVPRRITSAASNSLSAMAW